MIPKNDDWTPENQWGKSQHLFLHSPSSKTHDVAFSGFSWELPLAPTTCHSPRFDLFVEIPSSLRDQRVTELFETVCHPLDTWRGIYDFFCSGFFDGVFCSKTGGVEGIKRFNAEEAGYARVCW